ncbi:MAG: sigma-54-dependent Fis family transcriptional regulator [Nitrospinae bacterium]|nr:sigma-54-dependent Fis family transcriptional regulator [Nitrospinota bacterium]
MSDVQPPRILIVDDDQGIRFFLEEALSRENYQLTLASSAAEAIRLAETTQYDIALLDFKVPGMNGLDLMERLKGMIPNLIVLIITAFGSRDLVREAMNRGAYDFFTKPIDIHDLRFILRRAVDKYVLLRENRTLKKTLEYKSPFPEIIGNSPAMHGLFEKLEKVAKADVDILITGESGTGKELVADVIYHHSARAGGPFVKVNCAAIPDTLLESELFGHEKGAFTGAEKLKIGKFERANHGMILLDEITEMNGFMQGKLLRVIQERTIERLGGNTPIKLDFRMLAATNRDLFTAVQEERFREDLFYRLNVVPIHIPPLRERREDIVPLANHFLRQYCARFGKHILCLSPEAETMLEGYAFPGNVRQLENMIQHAVVLSDGPELETKNLQFFEPRQERPIPNGNPLPPADTIDSAVGKVERDMIVQALQAVKGRRQEAAAYLNISRKSLYNKMKKYGLMDG